MTIVLVFALLITFVVAVNAADSNFTAKEKIRFLEEENHRLANYILADRNEGLLLPGDNPDVVYALSSPQDGKPVRDGFLVLMAKADQEAQGTRAAQEVEGAKDGIDRMLDLIEGMKATGMRAEPHNNQVVNNACLGLKPVVTLEFGDLAIRDIVALREKVEWCPDLIYKGRLVGVAVGEKKERARRIFDLKMAEMAVRTVKENDG
jgi:hypothetical protein